MVPADRSLPLVLELYADQTATFSLDGAPLREAATCGPHRIFNLPAVRAGDHALTVNADRATESLTLTAGAPSITMAAKALNAMSDQLSRVVDAGCATEAGEIDRLRERLAAASEAIAEGKFGRALGMARSAEEDLSRSGLGLSPPLTAAYLSILRDTVIEPLKGGLGGCHLSCSGEVSAHQVRLDHSRVFFDTEDSKGESREKAVKELRDGFVKVAADVEEKMRKAVNCREFEFGQWTGTTIEATSLAMAVGSTAGSVGRGDAVAGADENFTKAEWIQTWKGRGAGKGIDPLTSDAEGRWEATLRCTGKECAPTTRILLFAAAQAEGRIVEEPNPEEIGSITFLRAVLKALIAVIPGIPKEITHDLVDRTFAYAGWLDSSGETGVDLRSPVGNIFAKGSVSLFRHHDENAKLVEHKMKRRGQCKIMTGTTHEHKVTATAEASTKNSMFARGQRIRGITASSDFACAVLVMKCQGRIAAIRVYHGMSFDFERKTGTSELPKMKEFGGFEDKALKSVENTVGGADAKKALDQQDADEMDKLLDKLENELQEQKKNTESEFETTTEAKP